MKSKKVKIFNAVMLIISIGYLLLYCHPLIISSDESFTLSLIHHSFSKIIYLDSLDVHPPLYYLLLKIFINRLTFWTNSVIAKVLVARLFSILATVITFVYLVKYVKQLGIHLNKIWLWIMFLALPNVLGAKFILQQMTNVRMYALAAMFTVMAVYYAFEFFYQKSSWMTWGLMTGSAIAAAYTHYYAAMFVGIMLLTYLVRSIKENRYQTKAKDLIITIGLMILAYVPWLKDFYKQFFTTNKFWMNDRVMIHNLAIYLVLFVIFIYPLYKYAKQAPHRLFRQQIIDITINLTIVFIITIVVSVLAHPIFLSRYFYPLLIVYEFMGICATCKLARKSSLLKINTLAIIIILILNVGISTVYQTLKVNRQDLQTERIERLDNNQGSPVWLPSHNQLELLQNYVYILYQGRYRKFNLKSKDVRKPILNVHRQTYANVTKWIEK